MSIRTKMSSSESFCRDKRLYDVRRGVVYLRRTEDLAQRQWRHYGAVPAIKTHVIKDIGITTVLPDVSMSQSDVTLEDSNMEHRDSAEHSHVMEKDGGSHTGDQNDSVQKHEDVSLHMDGKSPGFVKPIISVTTISRNEHILSPDSPDRSKKMLVSTPLPPVNASRPSAKQDLEAKGNFEMNTGPCAVPPHGPGLTSKSPSPISGMSTNTEPISKSLPAILHDLSRSFDFPGSPAYPMSKEERHLIREAQSQSLAADEYVTREGESRSQSLASSGQLKSSFHAWGSRDGEVSADRLEPLQPKNYAPKRYVPMSRVVGMKGEKKGVARRQLRTLTDFRSRNGTIRVIRPPGPSIDTKRTSTTADQDDDDEEFDVEALDREKTYAMLKRIDRLLEPTKAYFNSDLTSSQREICSSATPTTASSLSDSHPRYQETRQGQSYRDMILNQQRPTHDPRRRLPPVQQKSRGHSRSQRSQIHEPHSHAVRNRGLQSGGGVGAGVGQATLAEVVARLDTKGLDLHQKCQNWIKKCFGIASGAMTQRGS